MEWFFHVSYQPNQRNSDNISIPDEDHQNTSLSMVCHCQDFQDSGENTCKTQVIN